MRRRPARVRRLLTCAGLAVAASCSGSTSGAGTTGAATPAPGTVAPTAARATTSGPTTGPATSGPATSGTRASIGPATSEARATSTAPTSGAPADLGAPVLTIGAGGRSEGPGAAAAVGPAAPTGPFTVAVPFVAEGPAPLARPETACLRHPTGYRAVPLEVERAVDEPTRIEGTIEFPVIVPGEWSFVWSCADDHTAVPVVTIAFAALGVSAFSLHYYATVLSYDDGAETSRVRLVAHGDPTVDGPLRDPATSCALGTDGPQPVTGADWVRSVAGVFYDGTLTFGPPALAGRSFAFSCRRDYPLVTLGP